MMEERHPNLHLILILKGYCLVRHIISYNPEKEQKLEQGKKSAKKSKKKNKFLVKLKPLPAPKTLVKQVKSLPRLSENIVQKTSPGIVTKPKTPQTPTVQKSVLAAKSFTPK